MFVMELNEAFQVYVDEVVTRDHKKIVFDVEVVHAITERIGASLVIVMWLVAEVLLAGDFQATEEALTCFEIVAEV
jgi:hypothetical protein